MLHCCNASCSCVPKIAALQKWSVSWWKTSIHHLQNSWRPGFRHKSIDLLLIQDVRRKLFLLTRHAQKQSNVEVTHSFLRVTNYKGKFLRDAKIFKTSANFAVWTIKKTFRFCSDFRKKMMKLCIFFFFSIQINFENSGIDFFAFVNQPAAHTIYQPS